MSQRLIDSHLKGIEVRRTVRNWPEDVRSIVDGYRTHTTVAHAIQKDAIQNGWSARTSKKGKGWSFTFELLEAKDRAFLLMTDQGTTGLTGRVLAPEEYEMDLPGEERWGRFEGVAFTQPRAERTLGSRGRGKFIFVGASNEHTILYDTFRDDGSYRFGFRTVIKTESPVAAYDGEEGIQKLKEMTGNLISPLLSTGTRVIIVCPIDELVTDIKSGRFLRYIGETWWEIILKYEATIKVKADGREEIATIPKEFDLKDEDSRKFKFWIKRNHKMPVGFREINVKNLHMMFRSDKPVPEDVRGVAIQRDGMKICAVEPRYMGKEIAERLYGYINFGPDTEEAILEDEGIEHYSYDFRRSLPGAIKRFVEDEMMRFAQEKLGYGVDAREVRRQQQLNAERRALTAVNAFARALGIGAGPGVTREGTGGERIPRKVRIQMEELSLPRPTDLRVNYGETIKNIKIKVVNDDERDIDMRMKLFLRYYDKVFKAFLEPDPDVRVTAHTASEAFGPFEETFTEAGYPDRGKYTIVARIVSLMDEDKGAELDYKTKSFYLEEDPPMKGLFERCEAFPFPDEEPIKFWMGYSEYGSERGLVLYYNLSHPGYTPVSENEEDLAEYILRIAGQEICRYDLIQEKPILFKEEQRNDPHEILKEERRVVGELIYKFRRGEV
jgi:hypothetical protein